VIVNSVFSGAGQIVVGTVLTIIGIIGWPITAVTIFRDEQQGILGLSWAAVIISGYGIVAGGLAIRAAERVEKKVEDQTGVDL